MARFNDPLFDDEEKEINPAEAAAEALMDEAAERQGGRDLRDIPSYRWPTASDEQDTGY